MLCFYLSFTQLAKLHPDNCIFVEMWETAQLNPHNQNCCYYHQWTWECHRLPCFHPTSHWLASFWLVWSCTVSAHLPYVLLLPVDTHPTYACNSSSQWCCLLWVAEGCQYDNLSKQCTSWNKAHTANPRTGMWALQLPRLSSSYQRNSQQSLGCFWFCYSFLLSESKSQWAVFFFEVRKQPYLYETFHPLSRRSAHIFLKLLLSTDMPLLSLASKLS